LKSCLNYYFPYYLFGPHIASTADDPALIPLATILPAGPNDYRSAFVMGIIGLTILLFIQLTPLPTFEISFFSLLNITAAMILMSKNKRYILTLFSLIDQR
jgi:hypothetical protein